MKRNYLLTTLLLLFSLAAEAQKGITLNDIYGRPTFRQNYVGGLNWMKDGGYYTSLSRNKIVQYEVATGNEVATIFDAEAQRPAINISGYTFSADEKQILLITDREYIYRRSFLAEHYLYDRESQQLVRLSSKGKQSNVSLSPNGQMAAFTRNNNLFVVDLGSMQETQVTTDGKFNHIINGSTDWVYEEEFSITKAYTWSPDGSKLAFIKFDESEVTEYNMQEWGNASLYPNDYRFKYPKAGEDNAKVSLHLYDLASGNTTTCDIGDLNDKYLPRIGWTSQASLFYVIKMNRLQNRLDLIHVDAGTGKGQVILTEKADTYVDLDYCDDLYYLQNGEQFIFTSERSGYKHIYLYNMDGSLAQQVTDGNWEVTQLLGVTEGKRPIAYYISTEVSPLERHFYSIRLDGKKKEKLSEKEGIHRVDMSDDFAYYMHYFNSPTQPTTVSLYQTKNNERIKVLEENKELLATAKDYGLQTPEFFTFEIEEGTTLDGYMLKPANFDASKQYPLLMFQYSGPGSQSVSKTWMTDSRSLWHYMLVQQGYMVAVVDGRGTGYRGRDFKHITYKQLGKLETEDQISAAKYLGGLDFIDADRIGIWGWSYGGYMSSLAILKGADVFKMAIAVAPVTTWRFYDTIYTERYLQLPQGNASGYDDNSPIFHADKLKGEFLLIHGTGDDNVHFQNAVALQNALIAAGKQFDSFYYPDKAHGIGGLGTRLHLFQLMTDFVKEKL